MLQPERVHLHQPAQHARYVLPLGSVWENCRLVKHRGKAKRLTSYGNRKQAQAADCHRDAHCRGAGQAQARAHRTEGQRCLPVSCRTAVCCKKWWSWARLCV